MGCLADTPLYISSHQAQCRASFRLRMVIVCSCYEQPQVHENRPLCLENKDTACSQKTLLLILQDKLFRFILLCLIVFCFVYLPSLPQARMEISWEQVKG